MKLSYGKMGNLYADSGGRVESGNCSGDWLIGCGCGGGELKFAGGTPGKKAVGLGSGSAGGSSSLGG